MKVQIKILILILLLLTVQGYSQQAVPAAGGSVSGASGSFSFTVGEVSSGYFKNNSNSMTLGVQQTYASYTTQVQPALCATVLANLDTAILADTIVGAQKYRFEVSNGNAIRTIESVTNSFTLAQLDGGVCFGTVYSIRVAVQYEGIWYGYGTACTVTTPNSMPTAVSQIFCANATVADLVAFGSTIQWYASAIGGAALATTSSLTSGTYYASQTVNGCESTRTSVAVTITIPNTFYVDTDGDGYGSTTTASLCELTAPVGYSTNNTDCDDTNASIWQTADFYVDADSDGFGAGPPVLLCSPTPPTGYAMNNLDCNDGLSTLTTSCVVTLPLKVLIQGYFKGSDQMTPVRKNAGLSSSNDEVDEVTVALYSPSNVNQAIATSTVMLATNGTATAEFDTTLLNESHYYLAIQHKNAIKTWSATPVAIINGTTYDFTTAASQAYGNNQIEVAPGVYAIYSGDMNQDGTINEADLPIFTTANTTAAHGYIVSDLNGDGSVDLLDYPIYKNNADISVVEKRPIVVVSLPNVTIGTQVWQSSNLDVTTYRDGTPIPQVTDPTAWANLTTGAWCYYNNDPANGAIYGKLYNWYAVAGIHDNDPNTPNKILAPEGWHVPTDSEWTTLTTFLGGESVAGGKMKDTGTSLWQSPNTDATNSSGFAGLPAGCRNLIGLYNGTPFHYLGIFGFCWSSSEYDTINAWFRYLVYDTGNGPSGDFHYKNNGFSVRCLRD
jgi:uncharacterized protein (TIGR02145 family)